MAADKIRVGVIGASATYGWSARALMPALLSVERIELTAVCTAHAETARESAEKFGVRLAFHDHREMLAHPDIDAVVVSVRVPLHHDLTMDVLRAGKHVYTEWPLAVGPHEATEMAELAGTVGVHHMVGLQMRAAPVWLRLKELLGEGFVGDLLAAHLTYFEPARFKHAADRVYHADRSQGVNTLTVTFGHAVDIFCHCLGEFTELSAVVSTQVKQWRTSDTHELVDVTAPDSILVHGKLAGGAVASVRVAALPQHAPGIRLEVYGSEGALVATMAIRSSVQVQLLGGGARDTELSELAIPDRLAVAPEAASRGAVGPAFYLAQMFRRFARAIHTGERAQPDFETGTRRLALIAAVERASDEGRRQVLPVPLPAR